MRRDGCGSNMRRNRKKMPKVILGLFSIPSLEELKLIDIEQEGKSHGVGSTRKPM